MNVKRFTMCLFLGIILVMATVNVGAWQMQQSVLMTPWAGQVTANNVLPEYPRPQMVRTDWLNLNGVWQFQRGYVSDPVPVGQTLTGDILVPFPIESAISGVKQHYDRAWYRRTFIVPTEWAGKKVILNFGAVDWESEVYINGTSLGIHKGGYDPFFYDVTSYLTPSGPQELIVRVYDPTDSGEQARGKQVNSPSGIWYTATTGIWQTVWLEPVAATSIKDLKIVPDLTGNTLKLTVNASGSTTGITVSAVAKDNGAVVGSVNGNPGAELTINIPSPKLWTPSNPFLYDLEVNMLQGSTPIDFVTSYFGMRKIELATVGNYKKILLNGEFVFHMGPLDQGFWPDGIYTAPTDAALKWDLEMEKSFGFNAVRKHVKVEPDRWYYWADKLGLLVWQDMPSGNNSTTAGKTQFEAELQRMVETHRNHPSIVMWVVFNEGWGQYDTDRVTQWVMGLDPTRIVSCASGWTDYEVGHVKDSHSYPAPSCPSSSTRAVVNGEYGGIAYKILGHMWDPSSWGYTEVYSSEELSNMYNDFAGQVAGYKDSNGMSGAVYTQTTDVETEINGLITYDRQVVKPDYQKIETSNKSTYATTRDVLPTSIDQGRTWKYTFSSPASDWYTNSFNDSSWSSGLGGFGTAGTPGAVVRTTWNTADIWLRQSFTLESLTPEQINSLIFRVHHDEGAEIYLNGVLAGSATGYTSGYTRLTMNQAGKNALIPGGTNLIAVHCHQTTGGQYIDAGIAELVGVGSSAGLGAGTGLNAEYFDNMDLTGSVLTRIDANVNFNWAGGSPTATMGADTFSVRWTGKIEPRYSETYTFYATSDNGRRLWVNGQLIIDQWLDSAGTYTGTINLNAGQKYDLKMEYYENTSDANALLEWSSSSQAREIIPTIRLYPTFTSPTPTPTPTVGPTSPAFSDDFNDGNANGWTTYGGTWSVVSGQYTVNSGAGYKSVADGTYFTDFTYEADLMVGATGNSGLIFRVTNPAVGQDSFYGYYAGIDCGNSRVQFGKMSNNWTEIATYTMTFTANTMYHMKIVTLGSNIKIYVTDMSTPKIDRNDPTHLTGAIGFRSWNSAAKFDNVSVIPFSSGPTATPTPTPTATPGPAVLFSDGFESNNFTAGGWTNSGCTIGSTYKYAGTYAAIFNSSDSLTKARSTAGYQNIQVKYARYTRNCETDDHFIAEWYNGSAWTTLEDLTGNSSWTEQTWTLPAGANNNANFQIRFRTSHNGTSDYAYLDEAQILGTVL